MAGVLQKRPIPRPVIKRTPARGGADVLLNRSHADRRKGRERGRACASSGEACDTTSRRHGGFEFLPADGGAFLRTGRTTRPDRTCVQYSSTALTLRPALPTAAPEVARHLPGSDVLTGAQRGRDRHQIVKRLFTATSPSKSTKAASARLPLVEGVDKNGQRGTTSANPIRVSALQGYVDYLDLAERLVQGIRIEE
jgi:hypothetical protein